MMGPPNTAEWEQAKVKATMQDSRLQKQCIVTLTTLPAELLMHILTFVDARAVYDVVRHVCVALQQLIDDPVFWKVRMGKRLNQKYPPIAVRDNEFDWVSACVSHEEQIGLWGDNGAAMTHHSCKLYTGVDVVHLIQDTSLLVAGCRDRSFYVFDLSRVADNKEEGEVTDANIRDKLVVTTMINAHGGWIWSLSSHNNMLVSGSWDQSVKFWDIAANCDSRGPKIKVQAPVLCTYLEQDFLVVGTFNGNLYHIDPRIRTNTSNMMRYHSSAVLRVEADNKYIITASDDKTIAVYDRRAAQIYKTIKFQYEPYSISYNHNQLWVGDKKGNIHLIDASDGDFDVIGMYDVGHTAQITGILHTPGSIITCSKDQRINILQPTAHPQPISRLPKLDGQIARIDYYNNILVAGNAKDAVEIWRPSSGSISDTGASHCGNCADPDMLPLPY